MGLKNDFQTGGDNPDHKSRPNFGNRSAARFWVGRKPRRAYQRNHADGEHQASAIHAIRPPTTHCPSGTRRPGGFCSCQDRRAQRRHPALRPSPVQNNQLNDGMEKNRIVGWLKPTTPAMGSLHKSRENPRFRVRPLFPDSSLTAPSFASCIRQIDRRRSPLSRMQDQFASREG